MNAETIPDTSITLSCLFCLKYINLTLLCGSQPPCFSSFKHNLMAAKHNQYNQTGPDLEQDEANQTQTASNPTFLHGNSLFCALKFYLMHQFKSVLSV